MENIAYINSIKSNISSEKIVSVLVVIWPILNIYGIMGDAIGLGDIIVLPIVFGLFLKHKNRFKYVKWNYFWFFITMSFMSIFGFLTNIIGLDGQTILSWIKDLLYVFSFSCVFPKFINREFFLSAYKATVGILCGVLLVQIVAYILTGEAYLLAINSKIIYLKDVGGYLNYRSLWYNNLTYYGFKPAAFFTEPAKFVQYVSPCLVLSLLMTRKKHYLFDIILTVCIFLTTSASGVAYAVIAWGAWLVSNRNKHKGFKCVVIGGGILLILYLVFFNKSDIWFIERFKEIGATGINSGNQRIIRGWIIFGKIPVVNQLFGVGVNNASYYIESAGITTIYDGGYVGYMSAISQIFVTSGVVGGLLFIFLLFKYVRSQKQVVIALTVLLLAIVFSSSIINEPTFGLIVAIIEAQAFQPGEDKNEDIHNDIALYR